MCRGCLIDLGHKVGEVLIDPDRSAWNPAVKRPAWDRLERGVSRGFIVFYLERWTRQPKDGERMIELAARGLLVLDSESQYDPAARAAVAAGTGIAASSFAVLALVRDHIAADACCPHCGYRLATAADPLGLLTSAIAAQPLARENRERTSGRTKAERKKWLTEEADYDLTIIPSNLPKPTRGSLYRRVLAIAAAV